MENIEVIVGDITNRQYATDMLKILNDYMLDPMGKSAPLDEELSAQILTGLSVQPNYVFFLAYKNSECVGMANCFINFSTFKAKQLLNIHDFAVSPQARKMGVGEKLLQFILDYSKSKGYCRVNLEVRYDNPKAQNLYKKTGFKECDPPMYFWELPF
jgi:ribosomal protein S18 acetylase RimI-like enzyme